jgi:hypothetical protein
MSVLALLMAAVFNFPSKAAGAKAIAEECQTGAALCANGKVIFRGKMSHFGGPHDEGVTDDEDLALIERKDIKKYQEFFLQKQPKGTKGLARRLNPEKFYIACRWDYVTTTEPASDKRMRVKDELVNSFVKVINTRNGKWAMAKPVDWGPSGNTDRVADLSPGLEEYLGLTTDEVVEVVQCPLQDNQLVGLIAPFMLDARRRSAF